MGGVLVTSSSPSPPPPPPPRPPPSLPLPPLPSPLPPRPPPPPTPAEGLSLPQHLSDNWPSPPPGAMGGGLSKLSQEWHRGAPSTQSGTLPARGCFVRVAAGDPMSRPLVPAAWPPASDFTRSQATTPWLWVPVGMGFQAAGPRHPTARVNHHLGWWEREPPVPGRPACGSPVKRTEERTAVWKRDAGLAGRSEQSSGTGAASTARTVLEAGRLSRRPSSRHGARSPSLASLSAAGGAWTPGGQTPICSPHGP